MTLREAKKIQIGDVVLTTFGERHRVVNIDEADFIKSLIFTLDNGTHRAHTAIKELERPNQKPSHYYQILAFNKSEDVDNVCQSHVYPSYVSCMSIKGHLHKSVSFNEIGSNPLMLQSNPHDGLKFIDHYNACRMIENARVTWPNKEFHIIKMDYLFFGKNTHKFVIDL